MNEPRSTSSELRNIRRLIIASVVIVVVLGGTWGLQSNSTDRNLQRAVDDIVEARTEARNTTCLRDNAIRRDAGEAAARKAQDFIDAQRAYTGAPASTGKLKAAEEAYVESQRAVTLDAYPHRDCSKAGIDAFYANPPAPDPEPCIPDGKGLCQ